MTLVRRFALLDGWVALRNHRNFRLFWFGQLVSLIGTWMQSLAQAWLILQLTGNNAFYLGLVAAVQFIPVLILGLFGGILADIFPKRKTVIGTQAAAGLLAIALAILTYTHTVQVWHVFVLAFLLGIVNAVDMPTRQAFVPEMVGRADVANAVSLNSAVFNSARIVGPALAGLVIGVVGTAACFLLNGLSYLGVIAGLLAMRDSELFPATRLAMPHSVGAVRANLAEGLVYVRRTPVVLLAISLVGVVSTFGMNFNVLVPAMAAGVLDVGATGLGFLMAAMGVGALASALSIAFLRRPYIRLLVGGAIALGLLEMVFSATRSLPIAMVASFGAGAAAIAMSATANSLIQLAVPDMLRGRVMSVYMTVFAGSTPIGGPIAGGLAGGFGAPVSLFVGGLISALAAFGAAVWASRASLREVPPAPVRSARPAAPAGESEADVADVPRERLGAPLGR
jgi:MFS family permease